MKTEIQILFFGLILILTGCVTLYKPNPIYSPLLKEKGDLNASALIGASGCGLFNLQAAYAISDHVGIMIDGMYHTRGSTNDNSSVEKLNMFFAEAGAGYFSTFGNEKNGIFQLYSGSGYGYTSDKIDNGNQPYPEVSTKYFNIFIQPGLGIKSEYYDIAFDLRANYVRLFDIHAFLYDQFAWWNTDLRFYSDTTIDFMIIEPTLTVRAGGEKLKGILQLGVTIPTVHPNSYFEVNTSSMFGIPLFKISAGVSYTFGRKR